jgi:hypothetical protein
MKRQLKRLHGKDYRRVVIFDWLRSGGGCPKVVEPTVIVKK